jgi:HD-GYP domain-containing protein (c-di-GMP phosphodiesterase class II)
MTLKKIDSESLKVGMYVLKLHGPWLRHPFWRNNFLIDSQQQIDELINGGVSSVTVNVDKSVIQPAPSLQVPQAGEELLIPQTPPLPEATEQDVPTNDKPTRARIRQLSRQAYQEAGNSLNTTLDDVAGMFESLRLGQLVGLGKAASIASSIFTIVDSHPEEVINLMRLKTKDNYTFLHSMAVSALMILLARAMGCSEPMTRDAAMAGLMHDIGKASVPDGLLKKPGPLSATMVAVIRKAWLPTKRRYWRA